MTQNLFFFFKGTTKLFLNHLSLRQVKSHRTFKYGCENQPEKKLPVEVRHINNIHVDNVNQAKPR